MHCRHNDAADPHTRISTLALLPPLDPRHLKHRRIRAVAQRVVRCLAFDPQAVLFILRDRGRLSTNTGNSRRVTFSQFSASAMAAARSRLPMPRERNNTSKLSDFMRMKHGRRAGHRAAGHGANHDRGHGNDTGTTWTVAVHAGGQSELHWKLDSTGHGYDFAVTADSDARFPHRMAGRVETGRHSVSAPAMGFAGRFRRHQRQPGPSTGRAPGATRSDPAETPARRGSNIRGIGGAALISCPRKCSVLRSVRVKLRQAAFNNDIFANLAHTTRG